MKLTRVGFIYAVSEGDNVITGTNAFVYDMAFTASLLTLHLKNKKTHTEVYVPLHNIAYFETAPIESPLHEELIPTIEEATPVPPQPEPKKAKALKKK